MDNRRGVRLDNDEIDSSWLGPDQEYVDLAVESFQYRKKWYGETMWPAVAIVLMIFGALLVTIQITICLGKRRGGQPVIRRSMILSPTIIDNKNCGLIYKPLQEEIVTPKAPKRGSFYSCSKFHYDKIQPECV